VQALAFSSHGDSKFYAIVSSIIYQYTFQLQGEVC